MRVIQYQRYSFRKLQANVCKVYTIARQRFMYCEVLLSFLNKVNNNLIFA